MMRWKEAFFLIFSVNGWLDVTKFWTMKVVFCIKTGICGKEVMEEIQSYSDNYRSSFSSASGPTSRL